MNGILDYITGGGRYADPNAINPSYGVPYSDVRDASLNALLKGGLTLLAAGQAIPQAQRAQLIGQAAGALGGMETDILNASQRRLMTQQYEAKRAQAASDKQLLEAAQDPVGFRARYGFDPSGLDAPAIRSIMARQREEAALNPDAPETRRLQLEQLRRAQSPEALDLQRRKQEADLNRAVAEGRLSQAQADEISRSAQMQREAAARLQAAPSAVPGAAPVAPGAAPPAAMGAQQFIMPSQMRDTMLAAGVKPSEIEKQAATFSLNQRVVVPVAADSPFRQQLQVAPDIPLSITLDAAGNVVDWKAGEPSDKPPAGYRWAVRPQEGTPGRLETIPGGPAEKIEAEVGGRVGLAQAFYGYLPEIRKAIDDNVLTSASGRAQMATGVGSAAAASILRRIDLGKEALLRGLTGAGMSEAEAAQYAQRFSPQATDSAETIADKVNMLEYSLKNVQEVIARARGGNIGPTGAAPTFAPSAPAATGDDARIMSFIQRATPAELIQMDPNSLTDAQKRAYLARIEAVRAGGR